MRVKIKLYGNKSYYGPDYHVYINAYIDACSALKVHLTSTYTINDYKYYPLIYIYTHILELTFKNIINIYSIFEENKSKNHTHDLAKLWSKVKYYLEIFKSRIKKQEICKIDYMISSYSKINNLNQLFRYPDKNIHPSQEIEVSHFIELINIEKIRKLNYIFLDIEELLHSLNNFGFHESKINEFEKIPLKPSNLISKILLEEKFGKKHKLALFILKQHYNLKQGYKLKYDEDCRIQPKYIAPQKIQEIITLCSQRTRRRKFLNNNLKRNHDSINSTLAEIMQEADDPKLKNINEDIHFKLSILTMEELKDFDRIMSLGSGKITFFNYMQSFSLPKSKAVIEKDQRELINYLVDIEPLGEYLKKGLAIL